MSPGNWFHILGPNVLFFLHRILFAPYILWCLNRMSFGLTLGCSFGVDRVNLRVKIIDCF